MEGADDFTDGLELTDRLILLMRWGDDCAIEEIARVLEIGCAEVERSIARLLERAKIMMLERAIKNMSSVSDAPGVLGDDATVVG